MELKIQLPLDILQRRSLLRRLQTPNPDGDESEMQLWYAVHSATIPASSHTDRVSPLIELISKEHWAVPSWINSDLFDESAKILEEQEVQYGPMVSYHQMCRWNSGMFYKHPALQDIRYYWRVEPKVHFFCDIDYDIFRWMSDHNKTYGFTINLYDAPQTIPTLWPETAKFMAAHPEYLHENNAKEWVVDSKRRPEHNIKAHGYSTCHFWSNFEIGDMDFWRSKPYEDYFEHLDRAGGFFYERWGDAPVHSIALGLFEDKSKIHWYGFQHVQSASNLKRSDHLTASQVP